MTTLCIDTATEYGTVVVIREDGSFASAGWHSKARHAENLFGHIESVLADASASREDLSLIGVDIGPGRFTSLRVGLATAKGLAFGLGLPIVGVSSLRVLARAIEGDSARVRVPVMNGYRGDVFAAAYLIDEVGVEELSAPLFGPPELVFGQIRDLLAGRPVSVSGEGVGPHGELIEAMFGVKPDQTQRNMHAPTPDAIAAEVRHKFRTDGPSDLDSLEPNYLRPSDAKLPDQALKVDPSG
ncbi:MAG: tRNA (adenosine(37)-N6)-threonylcarbamoyltransferase complex dimerization subunit type 1 TsaB [Polyangiales bacterium]